MLRCFLAVSAALFVFSFALGGPIHDAAKAGDVAQVAKLLDGDKTLIEADDGDGWTPLHHAAYAGRLEVCKLLIQRGVSINHLDRAGNPPLSQAAGAGHAAVAQLLLRHGAWHNTADSSGNTPVAWAASGGSVETLKVLISFGATLAVRDRAGRGPLHYAAYGGRLEMVRWLIGQKCDVNAKAEHDVTPLHWAVEHNQAQVVQALIAAGANIESRRTEDGNSVTPLMQAARDGGLDSMRALLAAKAKVDASDKHEGCALAFAASNGHADCVKILLKAGADPNTHDMYLWTPLLFAASNGHFDVVEALVRAGAKIDAGNGEGNSPLTGAALNNHPDIVAYLVQHGANVNNKGKRNDSWRDNNAETVLHFAVRSGNPEIIKMLLAAGANPLVKDGFGEDAIAYATKKGQPEMAEMMAKKAGVALQTQPANRDGKGLAAPSAPLDDDLAQGYSRTLWEFTANGGSLQRVKDGLELTPSLSGDSYPGLRLRGNSLRTDCDWRLKFVVRYSQVANLGRGWGITSESDPNLVVFWVHADAGFRPCINHGSDKVECVRKDGWSEFPALHPLPKPSEWMTFEVTNAGGTMAVSLDGAPLARLKPPSGSYRLWFGPEANIGWAKPENWTRVSLRSLELQYLKGVEPAWVAEARASSAWSAEAAASPAASGGSLASRQLVALGGLDTKAQAPLQLANGDRPRITARSSSVQATPLSIVEFTPIVGSSDFAPEEYFFIVNGRTVKQLAVFPEDKPVFSLEMPDAVAQHSTVRIIGVDGKRNQQEVLRAEVWTTDPAKAPQIKLELDGEKIVVRNAPEKAKGVFVFAGSQYLGQLTDPKSFAVDARRIPPGQHEFYVVAQNSYGDLLPATRSLIEIKPRYSMSSPQSEGVFEVEGRDIAMHWTFNRSPGVGAVKTRIYLRGTLVAESDKPSFDVDVPLSDVPSGKSEMQVVGVAADGTLYARESCVLSVRNPFSDALVARDARAKTLQEMIAHMSYYDQQVAYWYSMAIGEPEFRTYIYGRTYFTVDEFGEMSSIGYLDTFTVRGHAQEYFARCKAAIVERAQFRLDIGKLQKLLGMRPQARSTFEQVIYEVGEGSGLGLAAAQELASL